MRPDSASVRLPSLSLPCCHEIKGHDIPLRDNAILASVSWHSFRYVRYADERVVELVEADCIELRALVSSRDVSAVVSTVGWAFRRAGWSQAVWRPMVRGGESARPAGIPEQGGGEKVDEQTCDALSLVVMHPMRRVGQALDAVGLKGPDGETVVECAGLFSFIGADPSSGWLSSCAALDERGFVLTDLSITPDQLDGGWETLRRLPFAV
jgi:hypothetical protein